MKTAVHCTIRLSRRHWLAALLTSVLGLRAQASAPPTVQVWLDLDEPVPADTDDPAEAARRRERVAAQQAAVAVELARLGAVEIARVRHARNAIAVRIDASRVASLKAIPGVKRVRPSRSLHPPKPMP